MMWKPRELSKCAWHLFPPTAKSQTMTDPRAVALCVALMLQGAAATLLDEHGPIAEAVPCKFVPAEGGICNAENLLWKPTRPALITRLQLDVGGDLRFTPLATPVTAVPGDTVEILPRTWTLDPASLRSPF